MSFVNRQLYKQKPQAWGPVSSVQASIFKNAEKIGIDPGFIYCPLSPDSQGIDYVSSIRSTYDPVTFSIGKYGIAPYLSIYATDGQPNINFVNGVYNYSNNIKGTFIICINAVDFYSTGVKRIISNSVTSTGFSFSLLPQTGLTTIKLQFTFFGTADYLFSTVFSNIIGVDNIFAIVCDGPNTIVKLYHNGVFVELKSTGKYKETTNTYLNIGYPSSSNIGSYLPFAYGFKNNCTDYQIAYLSDNPYSLLQRVAPVYYSVPSGSIGLYEASTSWLINATIEKDSQWRVNSDSSLISKWRVFEESKENTSWGIYNSTVYKEYTSWSIFNSLSNDSSWKILKEENIETAWSVFISNIIQTQWSILSGEKISAATAWGVYNQLNLNTDWRLMALQNALTEWKIQTKEDFGVAWDILAKADVELEYRISEQLQSYIRWRIGDTALESEGVLYGWDLNHDFLNDPLIYDEIQRRVDGSNISI